MKQIFAKLRSSLNKTRKNLVEGVVRAVREQSQINEELLYEIEEILITGDVGMSSAEKIIEQLRELVAQDSTTLNSPQIVALLKEEMAALLIPDQDSVSKTLSSVNLLSAKPYVILMVGVNGTGKTTTIAKLAYKYKKEGKKVLLAAADTFRAAAFEQLEVWARRAGADIVKTQPGANPAAVTYDSIQAAIARGVDVLIVDTAGRLHTKVNLMEELRKIHRVLSKRLPGAPHEVLLVLDATTGQNGLNQARQFTEAVGITGIVLAKLDGTAKGGIVVAICQELGIPVKYIGLGEGIEDLADFNPVEFVEALFQ